MIYSVIERIHLVTFDESILAYQPSHNAKVIADAKGEPIPVVFIKRKPHPNGLELFLFSSFINHPHDHPLNGSIRKMPYIVDCLPHLQVGDVASNNAFALFRNRYVIYFHIQIIDGLLKISLIVFLILDLDLMMRCLKFNSGEESGQLQHLLILFLHFGIFYHITIL